MNIDFRNTKYPETDLINNIETYIDKIDWYIISIYQKLSESFIEKYIDKVDWGSVSAYQQLSESFIKKYSDKVDWYQISEYQKLSESFIEKHSDKVDWTNIFEYQILSESFIKKHIDPIKWLYVSAYQNLSESFIKKYKNKLYMKLINISQKLSRKFIKKHNLERTFHHKTILQKKKLLGDIYEFEGDYVIAYKSVRNNLSSVYKFNYQYKVGEIFISTCDCDIDNEHSYGLSAWTKKEALNFYDDGKILKVKIHLNDLGAFIPSENKKLRCFKLEVLEVLEEV